METFRNNLMRAVPAGVIAYGVSKYALGYTGEVNVMGRLMDANSVFGIATMGGSLVGSTVVQSIANNSSQENKKSMRESRLIEPAVVGTSTYAVASYLSQIEKPLPVFMIGAGSDVLASYLQDTFNNMNTQSPASQQTPSSYV